MYAIPKRKMDHSCFTLLSTIRHEVLENQAGLL
jgi:hypothetical protein